jgi:hypothetical protein
VRGREYDGKLELEESSIPEPKKVQPSHITRFFVYVSTHLSARYNSLDMRSFQYSYIQPPLALPDGFDPVGSCPPNLASELPFDPIGRHDSGHSSHPVVP